MIGVRQADPLGRRQVLPALAVRSLPRLGSAGLCLLVSAFRGHRFSLPEVVVRRRYPASAASKRALFLVPPRRK
ncbi:hypothetical protein C791_7238 [Amycolatopsis azurea DSM 43854]|uniref:Uncharacterized protein n=1 Tax=Amycolatopsis azurea DSM 43854 TaxID=1238180 RepID=M2QBG5_9PSEU|nr:hypothetical protein C791_7238 [Amycolatopsis azurea DSM 43854]